jgi:hypothetical protein
MRRSGIGTKQSDSYPSVGVDTQPLPRYICVGLGSYFPLADKCSCRKLQCLLQLDIVSFARRGNFAVGDIGTRLGALLVADG